MKNARIIVASVLFFVSLVLELSGNIYAQVPSGDVVITTTTAWPVGTYQIDSLTVESGATLTIAGGSSLQVTGGITVTGNSNIVLQGANTSAQVNGLWAGSGVTISASSVQVDAGSTINANGQGYVAEAGPGGGVSTDSNGGSYGGVGGKGFFSKVGAAVYGSSTNPVDLGSGGGYRCCTTPGSGGGAIRLLVSGTLTNNGVISANGGSTASGGAGGGAGGSVNIMANTIAGTGTITATGGNGGGGDGSGSGGRIALLYTTNSGFNLAQVTANAGTYDHLGAPGTIVFTNQTQSVWLAPTASVLHGQPTLRWFTDAGTSVNVVVAGPQSFTLVSGASGISYANLDTTTVPDGAYELRLVVLDASGNIV